VKAVWKSPTVTITWDPSTDAVGVVAYRLVRDEVVISLSGVTSPFLDTPPANKTYVYRVEAYDAAGNTSPRSAPASVTTGTVTTPPVDPPPVVTPPPTGGGTRDPFRQPFSSDSPWNLPV